MVLGSEADTNPTFMIGFLVLNTLLFPFAKFAWDELRDFIMGDTFIIQSAAMHFVWKYLVNGLLFATAIFVAPLGIGYLWFTTRTSKQPPPDPTSDI